jgi:hypothetical protein
MIGTSAQNAARFSRTDKLLAMKRAELEALLPTLTVQELNDLWPRAHYWGLPGIALSVFQEFYRRAGAPPPTSLAEVRLVVASEQETRRRNRRLSRRFLAPLIAPLARSGRDRSGPRPRRPRSRRRLTRAPPGDPDLDPDPDSPPRGGRRGVEAAEP